MSAFQLDAEHIAAVVGSAIHYTPDHYETIDGPAAAAELARQNAASINACYASNATIPDCDPVEVPPEVILWYSRNPLSHVAMLKAIDCLEYQSCETKDWQDSKASHICHRFRARTIQALPGYDAAPWGIDSRTQAGSFLLRFFERKAPTAS